MYQLIELGNSVDGFQMLHAVYTVESFLLNLLRRKCKFDLVFFESADQQIS